jgi:hypothetical protein
MISRDVSITSMQNQFRFIEMKLHYRVSRLLRRIARLEFDLKRLSRKRVWNFFHHIIMIFKMKRARYFHRSSLEWTSSRILHECRFLKFRRWWENLRKEKTKKSLFLKQMRSRSTSNRWDFNSSNSIKMQNVSASLTRLRKRSSLHFFFLN